MVSITKVLGCVIVASGVSALTVRRAHCPQGSESNPACAQPDPAPGWDRPGTAPTTQKPAGEDDNLVPVHEIVMEKAPPAPEVVDTICSFGCLPGKRRIVYAKTIKDQSAAQKEVEERRKTLVRLQAKAAENAATKE